MKPYTYYGGPRDGDEVPRVAWIQDYVIIEIDHPGGNTLSYYYVKCLEHRQFEYSGEVEEEYDCE